MRAELQAIDEWTRPSAGDAPRPVSVHVPAGARDWRMAAWTLASWLHFTECGGEIVIHDDGTLTDEAAASLARIFSTTGIIRRTEADATLLPVVGAFPFCETFRADDPLAIKVLDTHYFSTADQFIVLSSGVLFFSYPHEIIGWADAPEDECWFTEALEEAALVTPVEARDELDVKVWPRVGDGIWMISKSAFDLDFIDAALARTSILHGSLEHAASTLAMLCAARSGRGGLLPARYEVSRHRSAAGDAVARHYTGPARERYAPDGLARVAPHLLVPAES